MSQDPTGKVIVQQESYKLTAEETLSKVKKGHVILRTMTHFELVRDARHVAPLWNDCTKEFWKGVIAFGYAASLSGASRNLVQAGHWDPMYSEGHFEMYELKNITGLSLNTDRKWRGGQGHVFWLETETYSYALQDPSHSYNQIWQTVTKTWKQATGFDGSFHQICHTSPQPSWWLTVRDWNTLLRVRNLDQDKGEEEKKDELVEESYIEKCKGKTASAGPSRMVAKGNAEGAGEARADFKSSVTKRRDTDIHSPSQQDLDSPKAGQASNVVTEGNSITTQPKGALGKKKKLGDSRTTIYHTIVRIGPNGKVNVNRVPRPRTEQEIEKWDLNKARKAERRVAAQAQWARLGEEMPSRSRRKRKSQYLDTSASKATSVHSSGDKGKAGVSGSAGGSGSGCSQEQNVCSL